MEQESPFVSGLQLSQAFYEQAVWPLLSKEGFSELAHSAGLLDGGSEVFGFDDQRSRDHHWGPRLLLVLNHADHTEHAEDLKCILSEKLPLEFMGFSTNFGKPDEHGVQLLEPVAAGPVNHRVQILTASSFFRHCLKNCDPTTEELSLEQWRTISQQALFAIRNGKLFHDGLGMEAVRNQLWFYPKSLWLEKLMHEWSEIAEEQAFVGRTGEVGDEIGSRLIAGRLLTSLMKITFLLEKEYYPYSKWFGTAFSQLKSADRLEPSIKGVLNATDWQDREQNLCDCYLTVIELQNAVEGLPQVEPEISPFFSRPFKVPPAEQIVEALGSFLSD